MALLARAALSNLRRQQVSIHCTNQENIDPTGLAMMAIGLDGSTALLQVLAANLDDDDIVFIKTPTPAVQQSIQLFRDGEDFMIFIVLEKQPNSICSSEGNQVTIALQLGLGTIITINLATNFLILSREAIEIFRPEIDKHDLFVLKRNQKAQADAGLGQAAGGGQVVHAGGGHPATTTQLHHVSMVNTFSYLFTTERLLGMFPGNAQGAPLLPNLFSLPAMESQARAALTKSSALTTEKPAPLSKGKFEAVCFWRVDPQKDQFSIMDFIPSFCPGDSLSRTEAPQYLGRVLSRFCNHYFSDLCSQTVTHVFNVSVRNLFESDPRFTLKLMAEYFDQMFASFCTFPIATHRLTCPAGSDLNTYIMQKLIESMAFDPMDTKIRFILAYASIPPAVTSISAGSGPSPGAVGGKRTRQPTPNKTAKQTTYDRWFASSPLPDCKICWNHVQQRHPCSNGPVCKSTPNRLHIYPQGTSQADKKAFAAWLAKKPES